MRKLVRLETGRTESLIPLITWLTRWEAWEVIDEIESRFQRQADRDAVLIYTLAQARDAQGNTEESERLAAKALEIDAEDARRHIMIALRLQETGMLRWAEREYRHVIKIGPADSEEALTAGTWLAELLHDQLRDAAAAKLLDDIVELARTRPRAAKHIERMAGRSGINVRARMHYFFALAEREAGNLAAHVARLDKAIAVDPSDGDVLIALYRLPRQSDRRRADTRTLIAAAEKRLDAEVLDADSEIRRARSLNQYAWLIGNTEGDIDKAIRYSQESLAIRPQQAGYLDTLAHCYAGKGDYESAVRYQSQAAELEPHSGLISRKLKVFQDELARRQQRRLLLPPEP
jgi:tetratricopeptide (TPR) repeat protein